MRLGFLRGEAAPIERRQPADAQVFMHQPAAQSQPVEGNRGRQHTVVLLRFLVWCTIPSSGNRADSLCFHNHSGTLAFSAARQAGEARRRDPVAVRACSRGQLLWPDAEDSCQPLDFGHREDALRAGPVTTAFRAACDGVMSPLHQVGYAPLGPSSGQPQRRMFAATATDWSSDSRTLPIRPPAAPRPLSALVTHATGTILTVHR